MVEFVLVLPIMLLVLVAILDFGRAFNHWSDLNQIAASGARFAAVDRNPGSGTLQSYLEANAESAELNDLISVRICHPDGNAVGNRVEVRADADFTWLPYLPNVAGITDITLHGRASMRMEQAASAYTADTC